jgi:myo-inositol-1(or 4)-monophosphatase
MRRPCAWKGSPLPASEATIDRTHVTQRLVAAMREAGSLACSFGRPIKSWTKGKDSPVTEADIAVDRLLRERLTGEFPSFGWLSEESEDDLGRLHVRQVWIVDPIDGTRAFLNGRTDWSISVALVEDGRPIVGSVFAPNEGELFVATAGKGATCNGIPLRTTPGDSLAGARVAGPRRILDQLIALDTGVVAEPRVHSLALRLARVAQGRIDAAFVAGGSRDWDLAAADLLVHEARGVLTTLSGSVLAFNRPEAGHGTLVAAGRPRHRALTDLLRERSVKLG